MTESYNNDPVPPIVPEEMIGMLKARATSAGVNPDLLAVTVDGIDHEYVLRMPTRAEWEEYLDWANDKERAVYGEYNLAMACLMWPSSATLRADADAQPGVIRTIVNRIEEAAGGAGGVHVTDMVLTSTVDDDRLEPFGITASDARALVARFPHKGQLRAITIRVEDSEHEHPETIKLVIKAPPRAVYETLMTGFKGAEKAIACYNAAISCIVWPGDGNEVRDVLKARPGVPWSLFLPMVEMGGLLAKAHTRKL